jgi:TRAP-type C4-dicarboxylate transport system permease small subunit
MSIAGKLVLQRQRHLKWKALDNLEMILMIICGLTLGAFSLSVCADIITRTIGYPWLWLQEVTATFFIYGIFIGAAVATRRNDHLYLTAVAESLHGPARVAAELLIRLIVLVVSLCFIYYGYLNYLRGFGSFRPPSNTPIASLYAAIPIFGLLTTLFTIEQIVNGLRNGFENSEPEEPESTAAFGASRPGDHP